MNVLELLSKYQNSPQLKELVANILLLNKPIVLKNSQGSNTPFLISEVFNLKKLNNNIHVIVLNDNEEAAYFHNALENITQSLQLYFFPSSFKNKKNYSLLNSSNVMLRTEALTKLSQPSETGNYNALIVTYPEALFEKVVLPKTLHNNIIFIKANDTLDVDGMMELFVMYGFKRTDFVYEPGQFALRGGILDIYSFGNDKPYRVELFGNEVDSIRIFDPQTQLSERKLLQVSIIPNIETQFDTKEKVCLLDFLPEQTIYWLKDWDIIKDKINIQEEELGAYLKIQDQFISTKEEVEDEETKLIKIVY